MICAKDAKVTKYVSIVSIPWMNQTKYYVTFYSENICDDEVQIL